MQLTETKEELSKTQQIQLDREKYEKELKQEKEKYKLMQEQYKKDMEQKYNEKLQNEMNKVSESLNQKFTKKTKDIENKLNQEYQQKEIEMKKKYNDLVKNKLANDDSNSKINTVHNGIKCEHCFEEPIVGYRYKCSQCPDYNLCQKCEEKNSINGSHPHDFIKIRKEENNDKNTIIKQRFNQKKEIYDDDDDDFNIINGGDDNNINNNKNNNYVNNNNKFNIFKDEDEEDYKFNNNNKKNNNESDNDNMDDYDYNINNVNPNNIGTLLIKENKQNNIFNKDYDNDDNLNKKGYSYECLKMEKEIVIYEGEKYLEIEITLKNNNNLTWPEGVTKLVFDHTSELQGEDTNLEPQKFNEIKTYKIKFEDVDQYPYGRYKSSLYFEVNGEQYGDKIDFTIIINERNEDLDKINEFRKEFYLLSKEDYPDDKILDALNKCKTKEQAFYLLVGIN
jgi:hypothetical protein